VLVREQLSHSHDFTEAGGSLPSNKSSILVLITNLFNPVHVFTRVSNTVSYLSSIDRWHVKLYFLAVFIKNYASIFSPLHIYTHTHTHTLLTSCRMLFRRRSKPSCIYFAHGFKYLQFQLRNCNHTFNVIIYKGLIPGISTKETDLLPH
jgi:hypothetical protein